MNMLPPLPDGSGDYTDPETIQMVVGNTSTPPDTLAALAQDPHPTVRSVLGRNPSTPPHLLAALAQDPDRIVRWHVGGNPSTPPRLLAALAQDPEPTVRSVLGGNTSTPPDTLTALAQDPDRIVRSVLGGNTSTPPDTLAALAQDPQPLGAQRGGSQPEHPTRHSHCPSARSPTEVQDVGRNPSTPPHLLTALAQDPQPLVRSGG